MNNINERTWKVLIQIATLGLYNKEFVFFKKPERKKKAIYHIYHITPDALDLRVKGSSRSKEISARSPIR